MKYGKAFLETINTLPVEWQEQAIEYRKLKKVINRVASELKDLGLTSEVLKDLLAERDPAESSTASTSQPKRRVSSRSAVPRSSTIRELSAEAGDDEKEAADVSVSVVVGEAVSSSEDDDGAEGMSARRAGKRRASKRRAKASYELAGTSANPEPRIRIVFSSASSGSDSFSDSTDSSLSQTLNGARRSSTRSASTDSGSGSNPRFTELPNSSEDDSKEGSEVASAGDDSVEIEGDFEGAGPQANKLLKKMYGVGVHSDDEDEEHNSADWARIGVDVEPVGGVQRRKSDETLKWETLSQLEKQDETPLESLKREKAENKAVADEEADDEGGAPRKPRKRRHHHRQHRKEVFIPLSTDNEFLTLLANALASLAALQVAQKLQFTEAVQILAREVSNVSSPSRPKTDLYIWREIFSIWIEAEIFESERERDRGERSTEEVEKKLNWFVDQVAKRKLAKRMKNKESRAALEKFIGLNVQLLEMKKFQLANEEAARKILKKHDKRTALTASLGFPKFIASSSDLFTEGEGALTANGSAPRVLGLAGFPSLPHILLTTFTSTLLPIIPQLEDYECAICGDVAFKPIRLECGHKFCVRCLVKMQKRGQDNCPQCRSPVVLRANASNLDTAMQSYLQLWFPKEVKDKQAANKKEAAQEELQEMGLAEQRCVVM